MKVPANFEYKGVENGVTGGKKLNAPAGRDQEGGEHSKSAVSLGYAESAGAALSDASIVAAIDEQDREGSNLKNAPGSGLSAENSAISQ